MEKKLTVFQFQREYDFLVNQSRSNEQSKSAEIQDTISWYRERLDDAINDLQANSGQGQTEKIPYGPEGDCTASLTRYMIPYGPATTRNGGKKMYTVLFLGSPSSGINEIHALCKKHQLGNLTNGELCTGIKMKTISISNVNLVFLENKGSSWKTNEGQFQFMAMYGNLQGFVFCLDKCATDQISRESAAEKLGELIEEVLQDYQKTLQDSGSKPPVLILAESTKGEEEGDVVKKLEDKLKIAELEKKGSEVHVQLCDTKENKGLYEGLDWLTEKMKAGQSAVTSVHSAGCLMQ